MLCCCDLVRSYNHLQKKNPVGSQVTVPEKAVRGEPSNLEFQQHHVSLHIPWLEIPRFQSGKGTREETRDTPPEPYQILLPLLVQDPAAGADSSNPPIFSNKLSKLQLWVEKGVEQEGVH